MTEEKNLQLERLVFFTDAVVAIAITLLALELKIEPENENLTYINIASNWTKFAAFFLSFFNIAIFWKIHHEFFRYIKAVDNKIFWYNIAWLLFIALLPFTTSLISSHFDNVTAMSLYCIDTFAITFFQNQIWDYVSERPSFTKEELSQKTNYDNRVACNVAMLNGLLAVALSFLLPIAAFIVLLIRFPMILISARIFKYDKKKKTH
ncbi:MAG: TMEM175 family protein [Agriterribacter sp.]